MGRKSEFSREEKIAAVKLVTEGGRSLLSVANEYGIHENTLGKWKRQYAINPEDRCSTPSVLLLNSSGRGARSGAEYSQFFLFSVILILVNSGG